jgi:hypothetical protein
VVFPDVEAWELRAADLFSGADFSQWDAIYAGGGVAQRHAIERRYARVAAMYPDVGEYIQEHPSPDLVNYFDQLLVDPVTESLDGLFKFDPVALPSIPGAPIRMAGRRCMAVPFDLLDTTVDFFELDVGTVRDVVRKARKWHESSVRGDFSLLLKQLRAALSEGEGDTVAGTAGQARQLLSDVYDWVHDRDSKKRRIKRVTRLASIGAIGLGLVTSYMKNPGSFAGLVALAEGTAATGLTEFALEQLSENLVSRSTPPHVALVVDFSDRLKRLGLAEQ